MISFPLEASIPYFFFIWFLSISLFYKKFQSKSQTLLLMLMISIIVLIIYKGVESDWKSYKEIVLNCNQLKCTHYEPLYDLLTYISSQTIGFYLIPFFSLFLILVVFVFIRKITINKTQYFIITLSIFFVYLPLYYGALRQSISFSFILISFYYFFKRKYYKAMLYTLISIGFHLSALIIIPLYLLYLVIWIIFKRNFLLFIILIIVSFFAGFILMTIFFDWFASIPKFNPGTLEATVDPVKLIILPVERIVLLLMSLYVLHSFRNNKLFEYISLLSITGALFYLVVYKFSLNTAGRTIAFFRLADVFVIYYFFKVLLSKNKRNINTFRINRIAILAIIFYSVIKYYFTIVRVGFFK